MSTTIHNGQIGTVDRNGDVNIFYPKTFSKDVYVNSNKKTLEELLGGTDISGIGDGTVSGALNTVNQLINTKAPTSHAVNANTYGLGTNSVYGHVKISDAYTSNAGSAANSMSASSKAVYDAYTTLNTLAGTKVNSSSAGPSSGDWRAQRNCLKSYHYEGTGTNYGLPTAYMDVLVYGNNNNRGIAFAVDWRNGADHSLYVSTYHNDSGTVNGWSSFIKNSGYDAGYREGRWDLPGFAGKYAAGQWYGPNTGNHNIQCNINGTGGRAWTIIGLHARAEGEWGILDGSVATCTGTSQFAQHGYAQWTWYFTGGSSLAIMMYRTVFTTTGVCTVTSPTCYSPSGLGIVCVVLPV